MPILELEVEYDTPHDIRRNLEAIALKLQQDRLFWWFNRLSKDTVQEPGSVVNNLNKEIFFKFRIKQT